MEVRNNDILSAWCTIVIIGTRRPQIIESRPRRVAVDRYKFANQSRVSEVVGKNDITAKQLRKSAFARNDTHVYDVGTYVRAY